MVPQIVETDGRADLQVARWKFRSVSMLAAQTHDAAAAGTGDGQDFEGADSLANLPASA
jgi:hypothetical protein